MSAPSSILPDKLYAPGCTSKFGMCATSSSNAGPEELRLNALPATAVRFPPAKSHYDQALVHGNVVVSVDYFKRFVAALRNLFGGSVTSYETLIDRARREFHVHDSADYLHSSSSAHS